MVVLSGDHIYKMDYSKMLRLPHGERRRLHHRRVRGAHGRGPRFGILNTDEDDPINEFKEKPTQPKSNKASMGVYIYVSKMRKYLELDEANPNSDNDFGKNIIPAMLEAAEVLHLHV